jgi:hypothetical protein
MSQLGQTRKYSRRADVFRCPPDSGHSAEESACPFCANSGLMQRSKIGGYSITSSARASMDLLCKNRAFQTEHLHGLLWSPSSGLF